MPCKPCAALLAAHAAVLLVAHAAALQPPSWSALSKTLPSAAAEALQLRGERDEARARATEAVLEIVSRAKYPPPQRIDAMDTS